MLLEGGQIACQGDHTNPAMNRYIYFSTKSFSDGLCLIVPTLWRPSMCMELAKKICVLLVAGLKLKMLWLWLWGVHSSRPVGVGFVGMLT